MKICTVVGARPQFIKAATVSRVIANTPTVQEILIHTGQHYDANMSTQFFSELSIPEPDYYLNIGSGLHGAQTGAMLAAIETVLLKEMPDWVLVYGDTNSTLAGALAASKLHIPVAHVEAGLRSYNRHMPEEVNRIVSDHISTRLLTPTEVADSQLLQEGIPAEKIVRTGDVMFDAILYYRQFNEMRETIVDHMHLKNKPYILVTCHRAENVQCRTRMQKFCDALMTLGRTYTVLFPMHPGTVKWLERAGLLNLLEKFVRILPPAGYLDMLALEQYASCIITDSGGVQKEAYFNQVPCITLRTETEWLELVVSGWNQLCNPDTAAELIARVPAALAAPKPVYTHLYGDGDAAEKVVQALM